MASKRRDKSMNVLVEEALKVRDDCNQALADDIRAYNAGLEKLGTCKDPKRKYRLHCYGINSIDPENPITREEYQEYCKDANTFYGQRWRRMCEGGQPKKVVKESEMESKVKSNEVLALMLAKILTSNEGLSWTQLPFPRDFKVPRNYLKACDHLSENWQLARAYYHFPSQMKSGTHSEAFRLLFWSLQQLSDAEKTYQVFQKCRKLMHNVSKDVRERIQAKPDPLECKALSMLFRAEEAVQKGRMKKAAMWLRRCTDLETELGGAPMCDAHLFARCINHAKRWKEDLYDPGHWMKELLEDAQLFVINLGPDATPRQACAVCGSDTKLLRCPCKKAYYCGKDHQKSDWKHHKKVCSLKKAGLPD